VALDFADLAWETQRLHVTIRRPEADHMAEVAVVASLEGRRLTALPHLRAWLGVVGTIEDSVFPRFHRGGVGQGSSGETIGKPKGASGCAAFGCGAMRSPAMWRRVPRPWGLPRPLGWQLDPGGARDRNCPRQSGRVESSGDQPA